MIGTLVGEYRIIWKLGEYGMGAVYLSEHQHGSLFAIKALAPQLSHDQVFRIRFFKKPEPILLLGTINLFCLIHFSVLFNEAAIFANNLFYWSQRHL